MVATRGAPIAGHRDQPVVPVNEVELVAVPQLHARREHVGVHPLHPGHELAEVRGALGLTNPVDMDAGRLLLGR
jgi:hypothetical protein